MWKLVFFLFLAIFGSSRIEATRTVDSYLGSNDLSRLQKVFVDAFAGNDLQSIYYASINIEPSQASERQELCKKVSHLYSESKLNDFEKDYYLIGATKYLKCSEKLPENLSTKVNNAFKGDLSTAQEIYYKVATHKLINVELEESSKTKIIKVLKDLLKKEDLTTTGYAFNIAPLLGEDGSFVAQKLNDAIGYADEVDGKLLQFEGGLSITALVINGIFKVVNEYKLPSPMTEEKAVKFANYFLSRRSVQTAKGAHVLIEALKTLTKAGKIAPICVQVLGNKQILIEEPTLHVVVVDLLGKAIAPLPNNVYAKISQKSDKSVLESKISLTPKSNDKTIFAAELKKNDKLLRGLYVAEISVDDVYKQTSEFKVLGRVKVQSAEISIADSDGSTAAIKHPLTYPNTLKETLSADNTQKLIFKTLLGDADSNKVITVHQAFVRLRNKQSDEEIIFIAEQDSSKAYKFEADIGSKAADFAHKSGEYELFLIVGDSSISNSFQWQVGNINLKFAGEPKDSSKQQQDSRKPLPEIVHQFRVPEKRPARIVSDVFTALCIVPLILLFAFWSKLGLNVSNFSFSPSTIGFHLGFGGILALFAIFWLKLNMFQTLRYLIPLAIFTFLCGHRLLKRLYAQRVSKSS